MFEVHEKIVLDLFYFLARRRYPDKSYEYVNKLTISILQEIGKMSSADAEAIEQEINQSSDSSKYSDIAVAYKIIYILYSDGIQGEAMRILDALEHEYDGKNAEQALELLRESYATCDE